MPAQTAFHILPGLCLILSYALPFPEYIRRLNKELN